jgi:hypothetical protein
MTTTNFSYKQKAVYAYPDGWTCISCGTEHSEKTIDVECYYVIDTQVGTLCFKCYMEKNTNEI